MLKIGKINNIYSAESLSAAQMYKFLRSQEENNIFIQNIEEEYVDSQNIYKGKITLSGDYKDLKCLLDSKEFSEIVSEKVQKTSINFFVDTHYEELVELKNSNVPSDSLQLMKFNASLEYNFLIKNYERYLSNNENILETALPYFYDVLSDSVLLESYKGFEGTSFYEQPSKIITSNFINEYITNIIPSEVIIDNKKLEISKYLEKFNSFKEQFPFYADIKFSTHPLGKMSITKAIQDKNLFPELFETIAKDSVQSTLFFKNEQNNSKLNVREMDITQFLNKKLDYFSDNDFTFIFDINQRVDNKARSFSEILLNKGEYAEVIGYHLKKFQGDTSNLIQEWYLPNTDEVDFNWVDTQIKYDKKYTC